VGIATPGTEMSVGRMKFCAMSRIVASDRMGLDSAICSTGTVDAL